jgi:membrane protease YdiL (CAAX protease family)
MKFVKPAMSWLSRTARDPPFWVFLVLLLPLVFLCRKVALGGIHAMATYLPDVAHSSRMVRYSAIIPSSGLESLVFKSFIVTPLREEFWYRFVPFVSVWLAWWAWKRETPPWWIAALVLVISSVWFGYIHGGFGNVPIQGSLGLIFGLVYLKMSAYGRKPLLGLFAATVLHGAYNFTTAFLYQQSLAGL